MRRSLALVMAAVCCLFFGARALGQDIKFGELNIVRQGEGEVDVGGVKVDDLGKIQLICLLDGRLDIAAWGKRRWSFSGRWDGGRSEVVYLTVMGGDGTGRGRAFLQPVSWSPLTLDLKLLEIDGGSGVRPFSLTFRTYKADPWPQPDPWPGGFTQMNADRRGGGTVKKGGPWPQSLNRAKVELDRDGSFEIRLFGDSQWRFSGQWRKSRGDIVELRVTGGLLGSSTSGTGTVNLKARWGGFADDDFDGLELSVRSGYDTVEVWFEPGASPPPPPQPFPIGPIQKMDEDRSGNGQMIVQGWSPDRLREAHVILRRDGSCQVDFEGRDGYSFRGQWSNRGAFADLAISGSGGDRGARGGGKVYFNKKGSFSRVEMNGTYQQRSFSIQFDVVR